jgi:phage shock protein A
MTNESQKTLDAVRALALKDLEAASDEDIRAEFAAEGIDPDQLAASIAVSLDEVLAASLRQQAAAAKVTMQVRTAPKKSLRPTLDRIKERIAQAFAAEPQLATAFREGSRQSDADLETLYDDLVLMGKITEADDGR